MKKILLFTVLLCTTSCGKQDIEVPQTDTGTIQTGATQQLFTPEKAIKLVLLTQNPSTSTGKVDFTGLELQPAEPIKNDIEKIRFVLSTLLSLGTASLGDRAYNSLFLSKAYVRDIFEENGKLIVDFDGIFQGTEKIKSFIKPQIEKNIAQYSDNFEIRLQRDKKKWDCLFETSGECQNFTQTQTGAISETGSTDVGQVSTGTTDIVQ